MENPFGVGNPTNLATLLFAEAKDGVVKPFLVKRAESIVLSKSNPKLDAGVTGTKKLPEERTATWENLESLEMATKAGKVIASRILSEDEKVSKITGGLDDQHLLEYLSDWDDMAYMSMRPLGETSDAGNYMHRRIRMVGTLKTIEDEWIKAKGEPQGVEGWQELYQKVFNFFDTKLGNEKSNSQAVWLKTYAMYYQLAWNYRHISPFEDENLEDKAEVKYRAILKTIFSKGKEASEKIMQRMSKLDDSTDMVIGGSEDSSPSFLFRKGLQTIDDLDFRERHK